VQWPVDEDTSTANFFEQRAAIREFDGVLSRKDAEILARSDLGWSGQSHHQPANRRGINSP
jgi:hypothetical protein